MKKYVLFLFLTLGSLAFSQAGQAQHFYVRVRPAAPMIARPAPPSPRHVWVENEWVWRGGAYVNVPGYWALPPRPGRPWIRGHWRHTRFGDEWIPGHWR